MKKLINGIIEFRKHVVNEEYSQEFAKLALEQKPDALFICCSDSRVAPNAFASTNPGDLFVIRNVGNIIPPSNSGFSMGDESEIAAFEFAMEQLHVQDVIICGHSECGAVKAIVDGIEKLPSTQPHLRSWLKYGNASVERFDQTDLDNAHLAEHNQISQAHVLQQLEHVKSYPIIKKRVDEGTLHLHGWWFELTTASVYAYSESEKKFLVIGDEYLNRFRN